MEAKCIKPITYENGNMFTKDKIYEIFYITITCEECVSCDEDDRCKYETLDDDNMEHFLTEDYFVEHFVWI